MLGLLTTLTVLTHFVALVYIGLGGFLAWVRPRSIFVHIFFALWGVAVNVLPLACPLTELENSLRNLQDLPPLPGGFNEYYIYDTLFPRDLLPVVGVGALVLVVFSYAGAYVRHRARQESSVAERRTMTG